MNATVLGEEEDQVPLSLLVASYADAQRTEPWLFGPSPEDLDSLAGR